MIIVINVVQPMPFLPPMTGNGKHSTYKNGDDWGMVYDCFNHTNPRTEHVPLVFHQPVFHVFHGGILNTALQQTWFAFEVSPVTFCWFTCEVQHGTSNMEYIPTFLIFLASLMGKMPRSMNGFLGGALFLDPKCGMGDSTSCSHVKQVSPVEKRVST